MNFIQKTGAQLRKLCEIPYRTGWYELGPGGNHDVHKSHGHRHCGKAG